jgi:hypothetical protein
MRFNVAYRLRKWMLVATLAGAGCSPPGGPGGGTINEPPEDGGGAQNVFGHVQLPAGSSGTIYNYTVISLREKKSVGSDGSFATFTHTNGVNPVWLLDEQGRVVFAGLLNTHYPMENFLDAKSTAVFLLFQALGGSSLPAAWQEALLASLQDHAETQKLATAIAAAYVADRGTFADPSSPIIAALQAALNSAPEMPATARAQSQQLRGFVNIEPAGRQDGVVVQSDEPPLLVMINTSQRNATYFLYRTGYETDSAEIPVDPPELVGTGPLNSRYEVNFEEERAWFEFWLGDLDEIENSAELPGLAEETLEADEDQLVVHYHLVVAGGHIPDLTDVPDWWTDSSNPDKQKWLDESSHMPALGFVKNVFLPAVFSMVYSFGHPLAQNLTGEEADAFVDELALYAPDLRARIDSGEWDAAARELLDSLSDSVSARAILDTHLNAWIGEDTHYSTERLWEALDGSEVYLQAVAAGVKQANVPSVLESHRDAEMLNQWAIEFNNSKLDLRATDDTVDPSSNWSEIQARVEGEPKDFCLRYRLTGPGCIVPVDEWDCGGTTNDEIVTTNGAIHYVVHEIDVSEGTKVSIVAELFESSCDDLTGAPRSTDSVEITHHEQPDPEPCNPADFDLAWWQEPAGYDVQATGTLGGMITTRVSLSATKQDPAWVEVFIPGGYGVDHDQITVSGGGEDMLWGAYNFGTVYLDVRRDEAGMQVRIPAAIQISISSAVSSVTITCPSNELDLIACPYPMYDPTRAEQLSLTGPIVGVELKGHLSTIDLVGVPED